MEIRKLKYFKGEKKRINVSLNAGIVKETKKLLKQYNVYFSTHIEHLLDQWCEDQNGS
jgi:hypothetical protein